MNANSNLESFYLPFYSAMRTARKALGLTQKDLAALVGITRASIAMYENGQTRILAHNAVALAAVLGLDLNIFLDADLSKKIQTETMEKMKEKRRLHDQIRQIRLELASLLGPV